MNGHLAEVPGGTLYYQTRGTGPALILSCGGPGNAGHHLGSGPAAVFGTSFGALIALGLAATAPAAIGTLIVHEPPLGQVLASNERQPFDLNLDTEPDPGAALNAMAASVGVKRGLTGDGPASRPASGEGGGAGARPGDVELFIRRDVPAIGDYHLDLNQLDAMAGRIIVTGSEGGRGFYPYQCAQRLAGYFGTTLVELPGNHAGMIQQPQEFAERLRSLLRQPPT